MSARPAQGLLGSPVADAASLLLFALLGRVAAELVPALAGTSAGPVGEVSALVVTLLGPLGVAIERGASRPVGPGPALLVGLGAAVSHLVARLLPAAVFARAWPSPSGLGRLDLGLAAVALVLGALISRTGARLDRGEEGWRDALRTQPPFGSSPLGWRIAASGLPRPLRLLLLPIDLPARALLLAAIRLYQLTFSRLMPPACRFEPTCSRYGYGAICRHGAVRGALLTGLRLVRCSPLSDGGHDPVPPDGDVVDLAPLALEDLPPASLAPAVGVGRTPEVSSSAVEESPPT